MRLTGLPNNISNEILTSLPMNALVRLKGTSKNMKGKTNQHISRKRMKEMTNYLDNQRLKAEVKLFEKFVSMESSQLEQYRTTLSNNYQRRVAAKKRLFIPKFRAEFMQNAKKRILEKKSTAEKELVKLQKKLDTEGKKVKK